jgi:hypothetical protein
MPQGNRASRIPRLFKQWAASALIAAAAFTASAAWADPPGRVGRVAETLGTVWVYEAEQGEWVAAQRNQPIIAGTRLSIEPDARAELQVGSATLRLDGGSDIEITELDDQRVSMHLHDGSLALRLRSDDSARELSVTTDEGRFEPERAGHYRIDRRDDGSFGGVISGAMRFEARDSALEINAGQRAEFWIDAGVTHFTWSALPNDRFADWVAQQDLQDERNARRLPYVSPEMTGVDDLGRYGDWDNHPEYGAVWFPSGVEPGWAPYRYGHWAYIQPWGYTWVDDAPWGFAPFHYGRWVWWRDRWAWCPGQYVARPVYAPALVAWIGGPNVSIGIHIGGSPAVGWVPLSPREVYRPTYSVTNIYVNNVNGPHRRWQPPAKPNQPVRTGPIMYTNQGVPGGVTVVSQNVLRERQPISKAVIAPVDARTIARWQAQPAPAGNDARGARNMAPYVPPPPAARTAPAPRVIATPGGAVPAIPSPPGTTRSGGTPWGQVAPRAPRAPAAVAPAAQPTQPTQPTQPARPTRPSPQVQPAQATSPAGNQPSPGRPPLADPRAGEAPRTIERPPQAAPTPRESLDRRPQSDDSGRGGERRRPAPQPAPPVQPVQPQAVQPAQGARAVPPAPAVVQQPGQAARVEPAVRGRGPKDADERDLPKPTDR